VLVIVVVGFVGIFAVASMYDLLRRQQGGDDATATYGVRWLIRHAPWIVILGVMAVWGTLMFAAGFLLCHFAGTPLFQP
jgi:uncharacterized membrane-anchored protein